MYKTAGFAASVVAAGLLAFAPAMAQQSQLTSAEKQNLKTATVSALAQVAYAKVAERQSSNAEVKQIASRIIADQTKALSQIRDYAVRNNISATLPTEVGSRARTHISQFSSMSGEQFDRTFFNEIQKHQSNELSALHNLRSSSNVGLQQLASSVIPDIQQQEIAVHTQMASMGLVSSAAPMTDPATTPAKLTSSEKQDLSNAASAAMAQIAIARMAERQSSNAHVKQLASQIVTDQTKALGQLHDYAMHNNVTLPSAVSSKERKHVEALSRMSGAQFDRGFFSAIERQQNFQVSALHKLRSSRNLQLQQLASNILPEVLRQQSAVSSQMASMGISSSIAPLTDESHK